MVLPVSYIRPYWAEPSLQGRTLFPFSDLRMARKNAHVGTNETQVNFDSNDTIRATLAEHQLVILLDNKISVFKLVQERIG